MVKKKLFTCFIVGDDNLSLQCAELILAANHQVLGLVSPSEHIKIWCDTHSIPYLNDIKELETHYQNQPFDFLFSIVNSQILPPSILKLPRYAAINYHNSPLPKYAGLYATTWAILNGEKSYAISWHKMEEVVDAGAILKQPSFVIEDKDTALSLNLKCYEHAVSSFHELIDELASNTIVTTPQNLTVRSYYGLKNKPKHWGFISWDQSADQIDGLCRALTFGQYTNQLVTPKVIIKGTIFVVGSHKKLNTFSGLKPGSIVAISNECLQVATKTSDIALLKLIDLSGSHQTINDLVHQFGLKINTSLDSINCDFIKKIALSSAQKPKTEKFWVKEFLKSDPKTNFLSRLPKMDNSLCKTPKITAIPKPLLKKLKQFSNEPNQVQSTLLTAVLVYLYRLNNYTNLSVGLSTDALRTMNAESSQFLSHEVPLSTQFDSRMTFSHAFEVVSSTQTKLYQNETYTNDLFIRYPELKSCLHPMEVSIVFINKNRQIIKCHSDTPLTLYCFEDCSGFYVHYPDTDPSYTRSHAFLEQMNTHLLTLLDDALNSPNKKLYELSFLGMKENNMLLIAWNNTQAAFDEQKPLHHYFEKQVLMTPNNIAVTFEDRSLTYMELNQQANVLARYLQQEGVKANDLVGICLSRSMEMLISILGILKSGAAYLPLDPNYPADRIIYMLQDSQCNCLILDRETIKYKPEGYSKTILDIDSILNDSSLCQENLESINKPLDLAYVIYTSGTTGKPKGVAIPHKAICNHMLWMKNHYLFQETEVFLQKTPISFDASVWEFFMPIFIGAKLIIAPNHAHASASRLINLVKKHKVSVLQLVPSMLKELVTTEGYHSCTSLQYLFCGGETLSPEHIKTFFKHNHSDAELYNLYGPTETTIDALTIRCHENDGFDDVSLIGQPISNTQVYVLDKHMQKVPVGITGELYIAGEGLSLGYLNNPLATQDKFLANPFNHARKNRLYKTGDLVKWNANGFLEYHGRSDNQVKIRGYRIELNEVERSIEKIASVRECIVVPKLNPNGSHVLAAYLVLNEQTELTAAAIRAQLSRTLPDYMIPNQFFSVDQLLKTPGGKIDRNNTPSLSKQLNLKEESRTPGSVLEHELKSIWCSALKNDQLGVDDDFFFAGGNSLSAMKIVSYIKDRIWANMTIKTLFEHATIASLAKTIERIQSNITVTLTECHQANSPIVPINKEGNKTPLFLIHPIGGSVFWYKNLGQYLNKNQPLYGIQDPGIEKHHFIFNTLEEMATYYIKEIQKIQPNGPYLLGGASFGTTVAVEMAKQLQENNELVTAILSLDGWASYPSLQNDEVYFQTIMKEQNAKLLRNYIEHHISNAQFLLELQWHREQMLSLYKLPIIQTKFILFKPKVLSALFQYQADLNWWDNYSTQAIDLHMVPGDHESMFAEPQIQVLAAKLNKVLSKHQFDMGTLQKEEGDLLMEPI